MASISPLQVFGALFGTARELEKKIQAGNQFTIDSHKTKEALQEILKSHETAMVVLAASAAFYRNICLGSLTVTAISGLASLGADHDTTSILLLIAGIAAITALGSGIMWWMKSSTFTNHETWALNYSSLIEVKWPPASAGNS